MKLEPPSLAMLSLLLLGNPASSAEPPHGGPVPELTNDQVRVLRIRIEPQGTTPMHEVPPQVVVWLTDADLELTYPDGRTEVHHARAGEARWVAVGKHAGRNLGSRPVEFLAIEPLSHSGCGR
jgi:hypothetical protein